MRAHTLSAAGAVGLLLLLGLSLGCGTQQRMVFDKAGTAAADRQRDEDQCVRQSLAQDTDGGLLALVEIDRDAYARCMRARGYAPRPAR